MATASVTVSVQPTGTPSLLVPVGGPHPAVLATGSPGRRLAAAPGHPSAVHGGGDGSEPGGAARLPAAAGPAVAGRARPGVPAAGRRTGVSLRTDRRASSV